MEEGRGSRLIQVGGREGGEVAYCCRSFMKLWRLPILTSGDTRVYTAMSFIRWKSALASSVRPGVCMYMWVCAHVHAYIEMSVAQPTLGQETMKFIMCLHHVSRKEA